MESEQSMSFFEEKNPRTKSYNSPLDTTQKTRNTNLTIKPALKVDRKDKSSSCSSSGTLHVKNVMKSQEQQRKNVVMITTKVRNPLSGINLYSYNN